MVVESDKADMDVEAFEDGKSSTTHTTLYILGWAQTIPIFYFIQAFIQAKHQDGIMSTITISACQNPKAECSPACL